MKHDVKADYFDVDQVLEKANPADFDAVVLPGGALNADALRADPRAQEFVRRHRPKQGNRSLSSVMGRGFWSPRTDEGRTLTSYYTIQDDIRNSAANG